MVISEFERLPLMGIVRGVELDQIAPLVEAVIEGGLRTLEITLNSKNAVKLLSRAKKTAGARLTLGAGTVLSTDALKMALDCGATFAVMPVFIPEVIRYCVKHKVAVFPGALTPLEIYRSWQEGAAMVKVFPAGALGPEYLREIKGPFNEIKLLACGGVSPQNIREYFSCGASAVAFGSSVFKKEWMQKKEYPRIISAIKSYLRQLP